MKLNESMLDFVRDELINYLPEDLQKFIVKEKSIEELNAQLVSLVGGNGAQLLDWCSKR